jgi:hypothetical protein
VAIEFSKLSDIEEYLRKQWSALFKRFLYEQKFTKSESRRLEAFSEELKDIKSLILSGISAGQGKEVGRGVLKYRRLLDFLLCFNTSNISDILLEDISWDDLVQKIGIKEIKVIEASNRFRPLVYLIMNDGTFYESRFNFILIERLAKEWGYFRQLIIPIKQEIISALAENATNSIMPITRHRDIQFSDFISQKESIGVNSITSTTTLSPTTTLSDNHEGAEDEEQ